MPRWKNSYLDSTRTVLLHKQIGINLVQLNLGWKSHDCNNSKLCRKISVTVNMQLCITLQKKQSQKEISRDGFYPLTQHCARKRGKLKGRQQKKSFCCARTKGLGNTKHEQSIQMKKTPLADPLAYPVKNRQHHVKFFFLFFLGHVPWRMTELCEEATKMHQAQRIILGATLLLPWPAHDPLHHIHLD